MEETENWQSQPPCKKLPFHYSDFGNISAYNTPTGLQEDNYYEMMYDLMDYVNKKGLTTRQAQSLFTDCADMILDVNLTDNGNDKISDTDKIVNEIDKLSRTIMGLSLNL